MIWIEELNNAIRYIEEHLTDKIDYSQAARLACCSSYHFQRMFAYLANVPLSEYIRRRRMSLAASDLLDSSKKIVDIAQKYGYDSPTAFNRAFQGIHGIAPSNARKNGAALKSYPPISFQLSLKGAEEMNYRIEKKEAFCIVGLSSPLEKEIDKNFQIVPMMWQKAVTEGLLPQLAQMMDSDPKGILGVTSCNDPENWSYYIAVSTTQPAAAPLEAYTVPAATWAIFSGSGTNQSIQELEKRIVTEWLPTSGYEYGNAPDIEVYLSPDPQNAVFEVWIPVVKSFIR